jgi:hypothetical protein
MLVCDIQGNTTLWTDPYIAFSSAVLGSQAPQIAMQKESLKVMQDFFSVHVCGVGCRGLHLPQYV